VRSTGRSLRPSPSHGGGRGGGRGPPLTVGDGQLQTDRLGAAAEQDALVVALVPGLGSVQLQRGAAARRLLPVLREGHGGPQPAHGGIPGAPRAALDAQGPAPRPVGRQRPDPQAAGGLWPHGRPRPVLCRGRAPAGGAGAGERGGGRACRGTALDGVPGSRALCGGGLGGSSRLQDGLSIGLPRWGGQGCGGTVCGDTRLCRQRCAGHGSSCAGARCHSCRRPGAPRGGGHGHRLLRCSCEHSRSRTASLQLGAETGPLWHTLSPLGDSPTAPSSPTQGHSRPWAGTGSDWVQTGTAAGTGTRVGVGDVQSGAEMGAAPAPAKLSEAAQGSGGWPQRTGQREKRGPPLPPALTPSARRHGCRPGEGLLPDAQRHLAPELHAFSHLLPGHGQRGHDVEELLVGLRGVEVCLLQRAVPPVPGEHQPGERVDVLGRAAQAGRLPRLQGTGLCLQLQRVREGWETNGSVRR